MKGGQRLFAGFMSSTLREIDARMSLCIFLCVCSEFQKTHRCVASSILLDISFCVSYSCEIYLELFVHA